MRFVYQLVFVKISSSCVKFERSHPDPAQIAQTMARLRETAQKLVCERKRVEGKRERAVVGERDQCEDSL